MTQKEFENGRSQAEPLPKEFRFTTDEVFIEAIGMFSDDYMAEGRGDQPVQERDEL